MSLPFVVAHPYVRTVLPLLANAFFYVAPSVFVSIWALKESAFSGLRLRLRQGNEKMREIGRGYQPARSTTTRGWWWCGKQERKKKDCAAAFDRSKAVD